MRVVKIEPPETGHVPRWRSKRLFPVLATMGVFPLIAAGVFVLLLWFAHYWNVPLWVLILVAIPLTVMGTYATWRGMRSWIERRFQFSLRTMMLGTALIALMLGTVGPSLIQRGRQWQAVRRVQQCGGYPRYWTDDDVNENWLKTRRGYDPLDDVPVIQVTSVQTIPALLQHPEAFAELQLLSFHKRPADAALTKAQELRRFPKLTGGEFIKTQLTDNGMKHLAEWTQLRELFFNGCTFTDAGLSHLEELPELESITMYGPMSITDKGLKHFARMSHLKRLQIQNIPITDVGLANLQSMTGLERLVVRDTDVTKEGFRDFCETRPDCWTLYDGVTFPIATQIRCISVWHDFPEKKRLKTITDPVQIDAILECLQQYVVQNKIRWRRKWDPPTEPVILVKIEGPNRCICWIRFGSGFFQHSFGSYHSMSRSEEDTIRRALGLNTRG